MMKLKSLVAGLMLATLSLSSAFGQGAGQLGSGQMLANPTANQARAQPTNASAYFDFVYGSTRGAILERGSTGWVIVAPNATAGLPWASNGTGADPSYQTIGGAAFGTQTANRVFAGPASAGPTNPTFRVLVGADLPAPGASSLGGVQSQTCASHNWFSSLSTAGAFGCTQPSFADLTSSISATQLASTPASHAVPVDVAGTPTWKVVPDCQDLTGNHLNYTQSSDSFTCGNTSGGGGGSTTIVEPQGRLTLTANTPVMTASVSGSSILRYDCYIGGNVPYYNGTSDLLDTVSSCEVTDTMVSAASAGQVVSGNVYDVWWVHTGTSRICLAMSASTGGGGGWASDTGGSNTARGTGYSQLDVTTRPYITNKNSISNCFNAATNYGPVSANQGTYLGTIYANANGQIAYVFATIGAAGGTGGLLGVYNYYNRVQVSTTGGDTGTGYTYTTATWRQARGTSVMQVQYVMGGATTQDPTTATFNSVVSTTSGWCGIGIGADTTSAISNGAGAATTFNNGTSGAGSLTANYTGYPGVGLHTITPNEIGVATCTPNLATTAGVLAGNNYTVNLRM